MKMNFEKLVVVVIAVVLIIAGIFLFGMLNPKPDVEEPAPAPEVSEPAPEVEAEPEVKDEHANEDAPAFEEEYEPEGESDELHVGVNLGSGGGDIPLNDEGLYVGNTEEAPAEEPEETPEEEPEEEPQPETDGEGNPTIDYGGKKVFDSFDEVDTSKLNFMEGIFVGGKEYIWFGEDTEGTTNGFLEAGNNGGQHIVADYELTGNIIGY